MIALSRTHGFFAGNSQILLTNNKLECGPLIGVCMELTFLGAEQTTDLLAKADFYEPDKAPRRWFKPPQGP